MGQPNRKLWQVAMLLAALVAGSHAFGAQTAPSCVDVALVPAVDSSASVSAGEFRLQQHGIARLS